MRVKKEKRKHRVATGKWPLKPRNTPQRGGSLDLQGKINGSLEGRPSRKEGGSAGGREGVPWVAKRADRIQVFPPCRWVIPPEKTVFLVIKQANPEGHIDKKSKV